MRSPEGLRFQPENPRDAFIARVAELANKFANGERETLPGKPVNLQKITKEK